MNGDPRALRVGLIILQYLLVCFVISNLSKVWSFDLFVSIWACSGALWMTFLSFIWAPVVAATTRISSLTSELSVHAVAIRDNAPAAKCLMAKWYTLYTSFSMIWTRHLARLQTVFKSLTMFLGALESMWTVHLYSLKCQRKGNFSQTTERHY